MAEGIKNINSGQELTQATIEQKTQPEASNNTNYHTIDIMTLVALVIGIMVACWQIRNHRDVEKKKASLMVILDHKADEKMLEGVRFITSVHLARDQDISMYAYEEIDEERRDGLRHIQYVLNFYEYIATGIHRNIFCDSIFKDSKYSTVIKIHKEVKPFITELQTRDNAKTAYQEFDKLAKKWNGKPLERKNVT